MSNARTFLCGVALLAGLALQAGVASAVGFDSSALYPDAPDYTSDEAQLIETLRSGTPAKRAVACKQLAIHGGKNAVPELAKLLSDEQLASWSRVALEAIPDAAADEALLKSAESLKGQLLVGTINSIGVRRSAGAVGALSGRLKDGDAAVASAAAVALGRIGDGAATKALLASLKTAPERVRSAVAEGCILCAERLMAEGKTDEAAAIYDEVRQADVPEQRIVEATRGAILARKAAGIPLLVEQLKSSNEDMFRLGLGTARELAGDDVTEALAAELASAAPERAALLLVAIADRDNDGALPPAVLAAAKNGDEQVRIAAIGVIGRRNDAASLPMLLEIAAEEDAEVSDAAKGAAAGLTAAGVEGELVARLPEAKGETLAAIIEVIGLRRAEATAPLVEATKSEDGAIRQAALTALGETIGPGDLKVLLSQVLSPKTDEDGAAAAKALLAACVRMPDREACAGELAAAMASASKPAKLALLNTLGAMGGPKAAETIAAAVKSGDPQLQDAGTRLLGQWMTADAAPVMLELAKDPANAKFQVRALRGYLRVARQFAMTPEERVAMARQALAAAERLDELKLALDVLQRAATAEALDVAVKAKELPGLREAASTAAMVIVQKLVEQGADANALLAKIGEKLVKVEIVKAEYGSGDVQRDVTQTLQQHVHGLPLIGLDASFNKSFGGDPAPGAPKLLKVHYTIDGKAGEAEFAENAAILLPAPK